MTENTKGGRKENRWRGEEKKEAGQKKGKDNRGQEREKAEEEAVMKKQKTKGFDKAGGVKNLGREGGREVR